ncbi:MAG: ubiquinol-cytochrome c reductase iron-sulfur subunit [Halothiobacillus sp.]|jgi:ubiquinol-cytochrome c reductase iron-sulfur subunit|nr:ubiquinol-cytochrome c reductase iron-sulfur subunit [Halothiobacillus sp.]
MSVSKIDSLRPDGPESAGRRRFLIAATGVLGAGAAGLFVDVLVQNMNPGKAVAALGAPIDIDVSKVEPGQLIVAEWKKKPVWILHREDWMLKTLSKPGLLERLKDPASKYNQQPTPAFVNGNYRALKPNIFVAVALCTHAQCIPDYRATPHTVTSWWYGGFHCPCHGSTYDFSARVIEGSPAPLNIPIPPYYWKSGSVVRIGETSADGGHESWTPDIW